MNEAEKAALVWETAARERSRHYQPNLREPVTVPGCSTMTVWVTERVSRTLTGARPGIKVSFSHARQRLLRVSKAPRSSASPFDGQFPTDGHKTYLSATAEAFGAGVDYAMLITEIRGSESRRGATVTSVPSSCSTRQTQHLALLRLSWQQRAADARTPDE